MTPRDEESCESRDELRRDLLADEEFRYGYAESYLNSYVAAQIKTLREQRDMTQEDLAERMGSKQAGISRLENVNYSAWKTDTLRRIARALGVRLRISFETFGSLLDEVETFSQDSLQRVEPTADPKLLNPVDSGTTELHDEGPPVAAVAPFELATSITDERLFYTPLDQPTVAATTPSGYLRKDQLNLAVGEVFQSLQLPPQVGVSRRSTTPESIPSWSSAPAVVVQPEYTESHAT